MLARAPATGFLMDMAFQLRRRPLVSYLVAVWLLLIFGSMHSLFALGTESEGWAVVRLVKFESGGLVYKSFEGEVQMADYDYTEKCSDTEYNCYTPILKTVRCSVRPENGRVARFLNGNLGREMLIHYRIHRIAPVALATPFEIIGAEALKEVPDQGTADRQVVQQTGSRRNFSIYGKILRLEYSGDVIKTYEGLYYDRTRDRVHPVSVTDPTMAKFIWNAMKSKKEYYIGISEARITGFRESRYDIFEINYRERAGASEIDKQ